MKTLYFELSMGASGDMIMASLYELLDEDKKEKFLEKINSLREENVKIYPKESKKSGISGTNMVVDIGGCEEESVDADLNNHDHLHDHNHSHNHNHTHNHDDSHNHSSSQHHHHNSYKDVVNIIKGFDLSDDIKENAISIYKILGEAESKAHNKPMTDVHFHEVGTIDAVYDIVASAILIDMIKPEKIIGSPIHVGSGHIHCAHGIMPVPAPATANILKNVPIYSTSIKGELCTPTGAAIVKHFVQEFVPMPVMKVENIGYGMGKKDFEAANVLRTYLGQLENDESIVELQCSMDDITGEEVGYLYDILLENNALEVYTTNIIMKKSRPGILLNVIVEENHKEEILKLIFKHSTTIGIKEYNVKRHKLSRSEEIVDTEFGKVRKKVSTGYDTIREKYEYEDLKNLAKENNTSISNIREKIKRG